MELKQHVKGVLIAIGSAIVILFVVSFFVGSEVRVSKSYVLNSKVDSVYAFLKNPKNFQKWLDGSQEFKVNYLKEDGGIQYEGFQGDLHTFRYLTIDKINGLEIVYKREDDEMAVIKFKASGFFSKSFRLSGIDEESDLAFLIFLIISSAESFKSILE